MNGVSLIICVYNGERFIDRAIRSCLNQVLINTSVEVIVVNDGSTDKTRQICESFGSNIQLINVETNVGVSIASNIGIKNAGYDYIMRVDSDDFINQMTIMSMVPLLEHNSELDFVVCDHVRVDKGGQKQNRIHLDNLRNLYRHGAGILFRKSALEEAGGYDESLRNCEDFDLLARLIIKLDKKYFRYPVPLYRYYIHGHNLTSDKDRRKAWAAVASKYGITYEEH